MPYGDTTATDTSVSKSAVVRYMDLVTDQVREDIRYRRDTALVTLRANEITIAYDAADVVHRIPIMRVNDATLNELAHAQRVANNFREELEAVRNTFQFEQRRHKEEQAKLEDIANEYRDRALKAEADLKRANAVIDYITRA